MLTNYFKTALRNLWKHRGYSLINVVGLSVGIGSCLLLWFVVKWETSYDSFHPDADRLYKVIRSTRLENGAVEHTVGTFGPLGPVLVDDFPEVETAVRIMPIWNYGHHEKKTLSFEMALTDPDIFDHFSFDIVTGDPKSVFAEPFAIFVTESLARRFFGDTDPIGKSLTIDEGYLEGDFVIRGVLKDLPANSHIYFDAILGNIPRSTGNVESLWWSWRPLSKGRPVETYIKLRPGGDPEKLELKLDKVVEKYLGDKWVGKIGYRITPIKRVWLYAESDFGIDHYSDPSLLYAVGAIAVSILLIACTNYVNLATARTQSRAVEVGLRKVVGAERRDIVGQFLGESMFITCLATVVGVFEVRLFSPTFNGLTGKNVPFDMLDLTVVFSLLVILTFVGLLSGLYPAAVLSSYQPATVLKGSIARTQRGIWLRRMLVVLQFSVSVALGIGLLMMNRQMAFVQTKDLGFIRKNIIGIWNPLALRPDVRPRFDEVRQEYGNHSSIIASSIMRDFPGTRNTSNVIWVPESTNPTEIRGTMLPIDENFLETYEIPLVSGRNFSREIASDAEEAFILTEMAAGVFGWDSRSALGKTVGLPILENRDGRPRGRVIGVVKDFHLNPLHRKMQPVVLLIWRQRAVNISIRYREGQREAVAQHIEEVWKRYDSIRGPSFADFEDMLQWDYWQERQLIQMSRIFGAVALSVTCVGLIGLTAFMTRQRMSEIGVRKVLGGRPFELVTLLTREVVGLVALANLIGAPIGYWLAMNWMQVFQYRVAFSPWTLIVTAGVTLLIAVLTVSYQTLSAVRTNPVDVLRNE